MQENNSLKSKTLSGLIWSLTDLIGNQGLQFIIQIILARLLLPEQFGLIGMILVIIAISTSIIDSGFTQALIREKDPSQIDYSTVFYFNLFMAVLLYGIIFISAELISIFFGEPTLIPIIKILSLVLIINSFGIIQRAILIKRVDFKTQTKINLLAGIISGIIAVICAFKGLGVWSLVIRTLSMQFIQTGLLWFFNRWIPSIVFSFQSFKRFFGFGSKILASGLIDTIFNNLYFILIGKFFSVTALGYYTNAIKLRDVASQSVTSSIQRVTYPVLSSIKEDETKLRNGYRTVIRMTAYIIFPFMIGLATVASPLIQLLFGDKWMPSVIYLQLLCFAGMLYPIHALNLNILQVKGRSDIFLLLEIIKKVILTVLISVSLIFDFGVIGLIGSAVIHSYIALVINTYYSGREISYNTTEQLRDLTPIFIISILMGGIVYYSGLVLFESALAKLIIQVIIGFILYIFISKISRIKELELIKDLILKFVKTKNKSSY
ncbi:lipopolysaccharide biosynthesis protein [Bacillus sp. JJ1521]|uniref:lipopolysaccharide biosynthesis protein n=1 Tax=Bacillus sp. JJ1521 TaxID=3122957 RepID=UPI002FFF0DA9